MLEVSIWKRDYWEAKTDAYHDLVVAHLEAIHNFEADDCALNVFELAVSEALWVALCVDGAFPGLDSSAGFEQALNDVVFDVAGNLTNVELLVNFSHFLLLRLN